MQRIEFSEMTNRLHRNAMAAAVLIISIKLFNLQIDKAGTLGIEIKNFTTGALVVILVIALVYHGVAFAIRAFEEYRIWGLNLTNQNATFWGGGTGVVDLANKIVKAGESLEKIIANSGAITSANQNIFTKEDAEKLNAFTQSAEVYAKRLKNFPQLTRLRFWAWDIGITIIAMMVAILFALSLIPTGRELFCGA